LVEAALASQLPLDLSASPALWGGKMRGTEALLSCVGASDYERAHDAKHASDLIQAHLIESLSCIGREHWDFYFLRVRRPIGEAVLTGVFEALEGARQEGHIRFLGLYSDHDPNAALGLWQFHDAFEALMVRDEPSLQQLLPLARNRRVGVLSSVGQGDANLLSVSHASQVPKGS
jgi:hypothetical protein